jgi:hypothetical protein
LQIKSVPTQRAPDVWESAAFSRLFSGFGLFLHLKHYPRSAHTRVTQTVGQQSKICNQLSIARGRFLVKSFSIFLWQATIPILWLVSVIAAFRGGFHLGYVPPPPPGQTYPYPWLGVIMTSVITAIESIFLYLVLRPHKFAWSIYRVGIAFAVFFALSVLAVYTFATDQPGYAYVPGQFTLSLTALLFVLLIITAVIVFVKSLKSRAQVM